MLKKRTVSFLYQVLEKENGTLLASGRSVHVLVDQQGRPVSFPPLFLKLSE
jgi:acyl-CoA thioesterase FadM